MTTTVITSQPVPSAPPLEEVAKTGILTREPNAPPFESVVITQPAVATTLPMASMASEKAMLAQTEVMQQINLDEEEAERRRQRNRDFCCFACADSYVDDTWCWYIMCRFYCNCLGNCCECFANCCDSCGEGCASCLHDCCESEANGNSGGDTADGCCTGCCDGDGGAASDSGDCDCDCDGCFD